MPTAVIVFVSLCGLLVVGKTVRLRVPVLQRLYLPSSVIGLMLLRTVDPDSRTCAAASFGYKQLLHEPIMGGGIWTALAFTLVVDIGWFKVFAFSVVMLAVWVFCAWRLSRSTAAPAQAH